VKRAALIAVVAAACAAPPPSGLAPAATGPGPTVRFDIFAKPLPEIPLPNDFAARFDALSPTHVRINASVEAAPTTWEQHTRAALDDVSGWGTLAPITVAFSAPLDVEDIARRHQAYADVRDDVLYVFDVTEGSPDLCKPQLLDLGQGAFPGVVDDPVYYPDEPHASLQQLPFEQEEEDTNGNGVLDPGEDTDMDGVLDHPNALHKGGGPFDIMTFYERETNTLIARPLHPLREGNTYAVVLTTRLHGVDGQPVRSPFDSINHDAQTAALAPVASCLAPLGLSLDDVAFTWSFTTQSVTGDYKAVREGLYGRGSLQWLASQYPAQISTLEDVRKRTAKTMNTKIVPGDQFRTFGSKLFDLYGGSQPMGTKQVLDDALSFVDFYSSGSVISPQFFPRRDADGQMLPLYDQIWKLNPATGEAFTRPEAMPFFLAAPKGRTGPAPVVIFVHGHGGSKVDSLMVMGSFARFGMATIGIDAVSHGLGVDATTQEIIDGVVEPYGLSPLMDALLKGRAIDWNNDGVPDPGADYWTAYVAHTRDEVRQTAVDIMQLVRVLRSFDGKRTWDFDVNRDGKPDLAGDFDGDGVVDLGGSAPIYLCGASLGGIVTSLVGGLEPEIERMVPILPGGYLSEIGSRSSLDQVRNGLVLRMMAPLLLVHPDENGVSALYEMLPDLTKAVQLKIAPAPSATIAVARNLRTGEYRCGRFQSNGHLRFAVPTDAMDPLQIDFYAQELPSKAPEGCDPSGFTPVASISSLAVDVTYQSRTYRAGSPFLALGDGYGLRRGSPELRRLLTLAQIVLESADPANVAPYLDGTRALVYGDGSQVLTPSLMVPMTGDPGVPIATGVALLRAAGKVNDVDIDPRYGKTQLQELIDVGFVEGVERTGRWQNPQGMNVLMDVDVLEAVANADDGFGTPRLSPPMRLPGALFPMMNPVGEHSFPVPDPSKPFDLGMLLINIFGNYLANGTVPLERCMMDSSCPWIRPVGQ
jgi:hypothetical protein